MNSNETESEKKAKRPVWLLPLIIAVAILGTAVTTGVILLKGDVSNLSANDSLRANKLRIAQEYADQGRGSSLTWSELKGHHPSCHWCYWHSRWYWSCH